MDRLTDAQRRRVRRIVARLEAVYGPKPWRLHGNPIDGLVRTILSQNTNDRNSSAAFERLKRTFADWEAVRRAPVGHIARAIRSAGLANVKAPRIKRILQEIYRERGELSLEFLRGLPAERARAYLSRFEGVGPKTAACVLMFNLGMPVLPVDTHVHRVSQRLGLIGWGVGPERAHRVLAEVVPPELVYPFHLLLIQHGREVCRRRRPLCSRCVLRRGCLFPRNGQDSAAGGG